MRLLGLLFLLFMIPLLFYTCTDCGEKMVSSWTYSRFPCELIKTDQMGTYAEGDTLKQDTIQVRIHPEKSFFTARPNNDLGCAFACDPVMPQAKNNIVKVDIGMTSNGKLSHPDFSLPKAMTIKLGNQKFRWPDEKESFIALFRQFDPFSFDIHFQSPHTNTGMQLVLWVIKENGDTVKKQSKLVIYR